MPECNGTNSGVRWGQVAATLACAVILATGARLLENEVDAARDSREKVLPANAAAQRIEMIDELRSIGKKLEGIERTVDSRLSSLENEMSRMTTEMERERAKAARAEQKESR